MDEGQIEKIDLDKVDWRGSREFFESLGEALDKLDDKDESYDFTWVGKRKAIIEAGAPINKTFRPDVANSKNWDTTENLFIEGDNLDALKLLQESYLGKVKMIYIDPPYNTGKDFVYHDNFKASTEQYDEDTEYKDESGNIQFKKNEKTNGRYHSDWLSMMYPRLKLARNLLTEDGVIFISIDDNESGNLRKLLDEILGEDNMLAENIVIVNPGGRKYGSFSKSLDRLFVYAKNIDLVRTHEIAEASAEFSYMDEVGGYNYHELLNRNIRVFNAKNRPNLRYPFYVDLKNPDKYGFYKVSLEPNDALTEVWGREKDGQQSVWTWGKDTAKANINELFATKNSKDGSIQIQRKLRTLTGLPNTLWPSAPEIAKDRKAAKYTSFSASQEVQKLFGGSMYFDFPKPVALITRILEVGSDKDCLVVDFFSGSATTAHAVMQLNAQDGGVRKWIMVQLPEATDKNSEAYMAGYKTIPEIARERIRRAGDKIASDYPDAKVDYGFRSLVIDDTNYKEVYRSVGQYEQSTLLDSIDNVKEDRSDLDLLFGVLTQSALELNRPLETRDIAGATTYLYDYFGEVSGLAACFDQSISEDAIKAIAALKPLTAVFRDSSFADSQAKVNLAEHFRIISPETKVKVI